MTDIGTLRLPVKIDWNKVATDAERDAKRQDGKMDGIGRGWGRKLAAGLATTFAVSKVIDIGGDLIGLGREVELLDSRISTIFGDSEASVRAWADSINEKLGMTETGVAGLAASTGDLLKPMGMTAAEAANTSQQVVDLAGALAGWSDQVESTEQANEILTKALLGERDGLQSLGLKISDADVKARLAAKGQADLTGEALRQATALATLELAQEQSTDALTGWNDGTLASIQAENTAIAKKKEIQEAIARKLMPAYEATLTWIVDKAIPAIEDFWPKVVNAWNLIIDKVKEVIAWYQDNLAPKVEEAMANIRDTIDGVVKVIQALWDRFGDHILKAAEIMWDSIKNRIQIALDLISGIFETFAGLFTGDWDRVWEGIRDTFSAVWDAIKDTFETAFDLLGVAWEAALDVLSDAWETAWTGISDFFSDIWDGIVDTAKSAVNLVIDAINAIISAWNGIQFTLPEISVPGLGSVGGQTIGVWKIDEVPRLATGSPNASGLALVGEFGPELVNLGSGSRVHSTGDTRQMIDQLTAAMAAPVVSVSIDGREIESRVHVVNDRDERRRHLATTAGRRR